MKVYSVGAELFPADGQSCWN